VITVKFSIIRTLRPKRFLPGVLAFLFLAVCFAQAQDPVSLVRERCHSCHELDKVCHVESNDAQWWNTTVLRMVEYRENLLTQGEAASLSAFLADSASRASVCAPQ
jgi:uncharacterized Fe-S center protein